MLMYTWQFEPMFKSNTLSIFRDNSYIFLSFWLSISFWLSHDTFRYILGWSLIWDIFSISVSIDFRGLLDLSSILNTLFPDISLEWLKSAFDSQLFYTSDIKNIALGERSCMSKKITPTLYFNALNQIWHVPCSFEFSCCLYAGW